MGPCLCQGRGQQRPDLGGHLAWQRMCLCVHVCACELVCVQARVHVHVCAGGKASVYLGLGWVEEAGALC